MTSSLACKRLLFGSYIWIEHNLPCCPLLQCTLCKTLFSFIYLGATVCSQSDLRPAVLFHGHYHRPQPHFWCNHWHLCWPEKWKTKERRSFENDLLHLWWVSSACLWKKLTKVQTFIGGLQNIYFLQISLLFSHWNITRFSKLNSVCLYCLSRWAINK